MTDITGVWKFIISQNNEIFRIATRNHFGGIKYLAINKIIPNIRPLTALPTGAAVPRPFLTSSLTKNVLGRMEAVPMLRNMERTTQKVVMSANTDISRKNISERYWYGFTKLPM